MPTWFSLGFAFFKATLAVMRASHVLSSERSPARLKARVGEVLGSMAGATRVVLALWDEDACEWLVSEADDSGQAKQVPLEAAAAVLPLTAFRYAERTREPLLLADAVVDDRFARDLYFRGMELCSLMVLPILRRGVARAVLVLENRASRGAFRTVRLDAVTMIAGQLAVSLENAQLYERLERMVREQTRQLQNAQSRLVNEARQAGMGQIATNVLHNVGNVLNSVNVSSHVLIDRVRQSRAARVGDLATLLEERLPRGDFFGDAGKGGLLPGYVRQLAKVLAKEREELLAELERLGASVDHIKNVVAMQQSYAGASGVLEPCSLAELVDDALRIQQDALKRHGVTVSRDYAQAEPAPLDKTRVMQILVNLIENAGQAMQEVPGPRNLSVAVDQEGGWLSVRVRDSGRGIKADNLARIFSHGFTTKAGGHGFGLHSCAVAAKEMGGTLSVHSGGGPGLGATFTLQLPRQGVLASQPSAL